MEVDIAARLAAMHRNTNRMRLLRSIRDQTPALADASRDGPTSGVLSVSASPLLFPSSLCEEPLGALSVDSSCRAEFERMTTVGSCSCAELFCETVTVASVSVG